MVPIKCLDEIAKNVIFAGGIWRIKGMQKLFKMHVQNEMYRFPKLQRLHLVDKLSKDNII